MRAVAELPAASSGDDMKRIAPLVAPLWFIVACGPPTPEATPPQRAQASSSAAPSTPPAPAQARRSLKLVLFPYIPDAGNDKFQSLIRALKRGFAQGHPEIDLQITIDPGADLFDLEPGGTVNRLLGSGADAAQVVELDTMLLGDLVANQWVQPTGIKAADAFPAAEQAVSVNGELYAVPTYMCTNVIYTGNSAVQKAANGTALIAALAKIDPKAAPLAGSFEGTWTLPSLYADAWADTNGAADLGAAYKLPLDPETMTDLRAVIRGCEVSGKNPCLDTTYKDNTEPEKAYALGKANGFLGYPERLYHIRAARPERPLPTVISAPVGHGSHPVAFVDGLVFNPSCAGQCLADARDLAMYMASVPVRSLIAFSQDAPQGSIPRYLLQASQAFYAAAPASADPMYKAYLPIVSQARSYPNQGYPEAREEINKALITALTAPANKAAIAPRAPGR